MVNILGGSYDIQATLHLDHAEDVKDYITTVEAELGRVGRQEAEVDAAYVRGFVSAYNNNGSIYMMVAQEKDRQQMVKQVMEMIEVCIGIQNVENKGGVS